MSIYLDNAATSFPKPPRVYSAVLSAMTEAGANPGRGAHRMSLRAAHLLNRARETVCRYWGGANPEDFFFTLNCTDALNLAIKGLLQAGDHAITGVFDHNSVLRPLYDLKNTRGVDFSVAEPDESGVITPDCLLPLFRPETKAVILNHISNVTGQVFPLAEIGALCRQRGVLMIADAAQSAGILPYDLAHMPIDALCAPGHKGLYGPQGVGVLYLRPDLNAHPLRHGGTGSLSQSPEQPRFRPDRYESGTAALPAIAGLCAGIETLEELGEWPKMREQALAGRLARALRKIDGITLYSPVSAPGGIVACNLNGVDSGTVAQALDARFDIACRAGLHCAPLAHRYLGTLQSGIVRFSVGMFNREEEIDRTAEAMRLLAKEFACGESG